jgi:hypothetical protein
MIRRSVICPNGTFKWGQHWRSFSLDQNCRTTTVSWFEGINPLWTEVWFGLKTEITSINADFSISSSTDIRQHYLPLTVGQKPSARRERYRRAGGPPRPAWCCSRSTGQALRSMRPRTSARPRFRFSSLRFRLALLPCRKLAVCTPLQCGRYPPSSTLS